MIERTHISTFLYKIIDDNQATIRFLDTKAGFGIAVVGALVGKVVLDQEQMLAFWSHGPYVRALTVLFLSLLASAAVLGFRTVFPTVNPANNVNFPDNLKPKFFLHELDTKRFFRLFSSSSRFAKLKETHESYSNSVSLATPELLELVASAEVLKLSFIRQIKTDRLIAFANTLAAAVALFLVLAFVAPKTPNEVAVKGSSSCPPPAHSSQKATPNPATSTPNSEPTPQNSKGGTGPEGPKR